MRAASALGSTAHRRRLSAGWARLFVCPLFAVASGPAFAEIHYVLLGTDPPPEELGGIAVTAFDIEEQEAIPDYELIGLISGSPIPGDMTCFPNVQKLTVPTSWPSWSHGYEEPVFGRPWTRLEIPLVG